MVPSRARLPGSQALPQAAGAGKAACTCTDQRSPAFGAYLQHHLLLVLVLVIPHGHEILLVSFQAGLHDARLQQDPGVVLQALVPLPVAVSFSVQACVQALDIHAGI